MKMCKMPPPLLASRPDKNFGQKRQKTKGNREKISQAVTKWGFATIFWKQLLISALFPQIQTIAQIWFRSIFAFKALQARICPLKKCSYLLEFCLPICWFHGLMFAWNFVPVVLVSLGGCFVGVLLFVCWFVGLFVCLLVGLFVCWFIGWLVCLFVGLFVCWLVCWLVGWLHHVAAAFSKSWCNKKKLMQ